jgi:hypothetical protein
LRPLTADKLTLVTTTILPRLVVPAVAVMAVAAPPSEAVPPHDVFLVGQLAGCVYADLARSGWSVASFVPSANPALRDVMRQFGLDPADDAAFDARLTDVFLEVCRRAHRDHTEQVLPWATSDLAKLFAMAAPLVEFFCPPGIARALAAGQRGLIQVWQVPQKKVERPDCTCRSIAPPQPGVGQASPSRP